MNEPVLQIAELSEEFIPQLKAYWMNADPDYLRGMGADIKLMPSGEQWESSLRSQLALPYEHKLAFALIWLIDGEPCGHSNVNPLVYGDHAFMHLHIWKAELRGRGHAEKLLRKSIPYFFEKLQLKKIYSEPYALNPAPHKTLQKLGFQLEKEYITKPGAICFEQLVKRWVLDKENAAGFL